MKKILLFVCFICFAVVGFGQLPSYVDSSSLGGWWSFTGNALDSGQYHNNGTVHSASLTTDRFGNSNSAYSFNGSTSYIDIPDNNALDLANTFTISLWVKINDFSAGIGMVSKPRTAGNTGYALRALDAGTTGHPAGNNYTFAANDGGSVNNVLFSNDTLTTGVWQHIVVTYNGSIENIYRNDTLVASDTITYTLANSIQSLLFGKEFNTGTSDRWFAGALDDIGIWRRALTRCEISKLYNARADLPYAGVISGPSSTYLGASISLANGTAGGSWNSSNTGVATVDLSGVVTGVSNGTTIISYTVTNACGTAVSTKTITVSGIAPISGATAVCVSGLASLTNATPGGVWVSRSPAIASVGSISGLVSGIAAGTSVISYTYSGSTVTTTITVNPRPAAITGSARICTSFSSLLRCNTAGGIWTSENRAVASVGSLDGSTTGVTPGLTNISYTLGTGCASMVTVTINPSPSAIIGTPSVCEGATTFLSDTTPGGTWYSGHPAIATVGSTGAVFGVSGGYATIYYIHSSGCYVTVNFAVNPLNLPILGNNNICVGSTTRYTNGALGGTWSSSNSAVASIGTTGIVTGLSAGTAIISYFISVSCGTRTIITTTVRVNNLPTISLGSTPVVCVGSTAAQLSYSGVTGSPATYSITWSDTAQARGFENIEPAGIIRTVAGTYAFGNTGDGGPATAARMYAPIDVALDSSNNMFIADYYNQAVRKVNTSGIITRYAGNGGISYSGDGGPATNAGFYHPIKTIVDKNGNLFIADIYNSVVRKVTPAGIITTVAGNGIIGFSGNGGPATAASLYYPAGIAVDTIGNLYISDYGNQVVRKVNTSGIISTYAGNRSAGYSGDGGPATAARMYNPWGMAIDKNGNLIVVEYSNWVVRKITPSGYISTVAGTNAIGYSGDGGPATAAAINYCYGMTIDSSGAIYLSESSNNVVRRIDTNGIINTIAGVGIAGFSGNGGLALSANLNYPTGVKINKAGDIYISDFSNAQVRMMGHGTWLPSSPIAITVPPTGPGSFNGVLKVSNGVCTSTGYNIRVRVTASPGAIAGASTVCSGDSITMACATPGGIWTSSAPAVATVGSTTGVVLGLSTGTTVISYAVGSGCTVTKTVTVNGLPDAGTISGSSIVCVGATELITTTSGGGSWSSSNTAVVTVDTAGNIRGIIAGTATITYTVTSSCGGGTAIATATVGVLPAPDAGAITGSGSVCESATITLSNSTTGGAWSSSNTGVATVSSGGTVTGVSAGATTISYAVSNSCGAATATKTITVNPNPSVSAITGSGSVCESASITLSNTTTGGAWSSSNTGVAIVSGGVVTGVSAGAATISYAVSNSCGTATATKTITVNPNPSVSAITGSGSVCESASITLSNSTTGGAWSSNNTGVATVSGGVVTGVSTGVATISYTVSNSCGSVTATKTITVNPNPSVSAITGSGSVCESASNTLSNSTTGGAWSSSNTGVATVSGGVVTGVSTGVATISYTVSNSCGTATATKAITVNPSPSVSAITGSGSVCESASITLSNSTTGGAWSSSNTGVAIVSSGGVVTGVSAGAATISYAVSNSCGTATATKTITVNPNPSVSAITGSGSVCESASITLSSSTTGGAWSSSNTGVATVSGGVVTGVSAGVATISYSVSNSCGTAIATKTIAVNPNPSVSAITGSGSVCESATITLSNSTTGGAWSSSNTGVATVSGGVVTGVSTGVTTISYAVSNSCGTATATKTITVNPNPSVSAITGSGSVCESASITLSNSTTGGTWSSSNTGVATVSSGGVVTGVSTGVATISYTVSNSCGSVTATKTITVNALPDAGAISGLSTVVAGSTITLSSSSTGGVWTSSSSAIASVGSAGVVAGVSAGIAIISYNVTTGCGSASAIKSITVTSGVLGPISGPGSICIARTATLTNSTSGGTWRSSSTAVATIGSVSGVLTGVAAGTSIISYTVGTSRVTTVVTVMPLPVAITGTAVMCAGFTTTLATTSTGGTWSSENTAVATVGTGGGVVTGVSGGTSFITYTLPTGCIAIKNVTVNQTPAIGGNPQVCVASTTTLTNITTGGTWASGSTGVATIVSTTGVATGVSFGTAIITYTLSTGCKAFTTVSVVAASSISGITGLCPGQTTTLSNVITGGTWSSSATARATIGSVSGVVTGVSAGTALITYAISANCRSLQAVTVAPLPAAITGASAVCGGFNTTLANTTTGGTWVSSADAIATIGSLSGIATGVSAGILVITYTSIPGCQAFKSLTVNVTPPIGGPTAVCLASTTTLTNTTAGGTWTSGTPAVATIVATTGVTTGVAAGTANITYTLSTGCRAITTVTVGTASAITGTAAVCVGLTTPLANAFGGGTWSSSAVLKATVDATSGVVTGVAAGSATITYVLGPTCRVTKTVTVNPVPAAIGGASMVCTGQTITLTDATAGGKWGSNNTALATVGSTTGIVAGVATGNVTISYALTTGCLSSKTLAVQPISSIVGYNRVCVGQSMTLTNATSGGVWTSSAPSFATANAISGLISGIAAGATTITYAMPTGCRVTLPVTVSSLAAIAGLGNVCQGQTITLTNATTGGSWASNDISIASVGSSTGVVTGLTASTATVTYAIGSGCVTTKSVNIIPFSAIVGPGGVCIGQTITLTEATPGGLWTSSNNAVARVGSLSGVVSGIGTGNVNISYSTSSCRSVKLISVGTLSPIAGPSSVCIGQNITATDLVGGGVWSSSDPATLIVGSSSGVVTGVAAGTAVITYLVGSGGCMVYKTILVNPLAGITGPSSVCVGQTVTLADGLPGGVWSSNNTTIATIGSGSGVVTGVLGGYVTISYTISSTGCRTTAPMTVNRLSPIGGPAAVCQGQTVTLTNVDAGGRWLSENTAIATVGTAISVVTGIGAGTTIISYSLPTGCVTTRTQTVNPISPITGGVTVCTSTPLTLYNATTGGIWTSGNTTVARVGSTTGIVTGLLRSATTISYTMPGTGCRVTSPITVNVCRIAGEQATPTNRAAELTLTPNPNNGQFLLTGVLSTQEDQTLMLEVANMAGQSVYKNSVSALGGRIDVQIELTASLANGAYLLNLYSRDTHLVYQFILNR